MIAVREVSTDDELELWTRVRNRVDTRNPTTIEDVHRARKHQPELRHWLAEHGGEPVGCLLLARSSVPGRAFVLPRVVPEARGRGVGTSLLEASVAAIRGLDCERLRSQVDGNDLDALRFASRRGFAEVDRQVELVRPLAAGEPPAVPPAGIELAVFPPERAEELRTLLAQAIEDMPVVGGIGAHFVDELVDDIGGSRHLVVARDGGEVVGLAGLTRYGAVDDALEHAMTTVARTHRGRGIAQALKQACVHWAAGAGYRELVTWTQRGNEAMQAVNERVGFRPAQIAITVEGPVP